MSRYRDDFGFSARRRNYFRSGWWLLVSRINGSSMTINGPAVGFIVVVYAAVQTLGEGDALAGARYALAAIVVASVSSGAAGNVSKLQVHRRICGSGTSMK